MEEQTYRQQEFAHAFVETLWSSLLARRDQAGAAYPFEVTRTHVRLRTRWQDAVFFAFCLVASARRLYSQAAAVTTGVFNDQGQLFEELVGQAYTGLGFSIHHVGWSRKHRATIETRISDLATALNELMSDGATKRWLSRDAKDAGTDLVAWLPLNDGRGARPVLLVQCASGTNWSQKLTQPDLETWKKLIEFSSSPRRAIAIPFALTYDSIRTACHRDGNILVTDRNRLAVGCARVSTTPEAVALTGRLAEWIEPTLAQVVRRAM